MVYGVVIAWVLIGLGVFFVAIRGGPRGARGALHEESKGSRRVVWLAVILLFGFGIAVPTIVLADNAANKASVAPGGVTLTALQQHGRYLFSQSCSNCHTLYASHAVGRVGPNLDILRPPAALVLNAILTGRARGNGNMPALLYQGRDAQAVASYVAAVAGRP